MADIPDTIRVDSDAKKEAQVVLSLMSRMGFMDDPPTILRGALREGLRCRRKRLERANSK